MRISDGAFYRARGGRLFWRDLHGTTGFLAAGAILFLAVTGMPWTQVWGGGLRAAIAANDLGRLHSSR